MTTMQGHGTMIVDAIRIEIPEDSVVEALRRMTSAERLAIANRMWISARNAVGYIVRSEHPDWNEQQLQQEVLRRMLNGAV
jgi:hypothetical protein